MEKFAMTLLYKDYKSIKTSYEKKCQLIHILIL